MKFIFPRWLIAALFAIGMVMGSVEATAREVVVDDEIVRLGDLFEGMSDHQAKTPVAKAPSPGRQVTVKPSWLRRLASNHGVTVQNLEPVTVRRSGSTITTDSLQPVLQEAIANKTGLEDFEVRLDGGAFQLTVAGTDNPDLSIENLRFDPSEGQFSAALFAREGENVQLERPISGRVIAMVKMPVMARSISSGSIISANDLTTVALAADSIAANAVTDIREVIGRVADRSLRAGRPILEHHIAEPIVVKRGSLVTMQFQQGALTINARGRALSNGALGESIRVLNIDSGRTVDAEAIGQDLVAMGTSASALEITTAAN